MAAASPVDPGLAALRRESRENPRAAARAAATQFEQMFVQMLLKSMREATPQFDPLASSQGRMFQEMLDTHLSAAIARRGVGLAPMIERQMLRGVPAPVPPPAQAAAPASPAAPAAPAPAGPARTEGQQQFLNRMLRPAEEASRRSGIPAAFILGQAALESGWGRHEIRGPQGEPTHNLFGIKAGRGWTGATVEASTTEFVDGAPRRQRERFRAYGSYDEAFADYARLVAGNPRYAEARGAGADPERFARAMARAGYATDPAYARKLARTIAGALALG
jgi:flagellar protein FlgJ